MKDKTITRRDFLRVTAGTAMAAALGSRIVGDAWAETTAEVILIRNAGVFRTPRQSTGGDPAIDAG